MLKRFLKFWPCSLFALALIALTASSALGQDSAALKNNLVYEIFVRSFYDGRPDPKAMGDLAGITQQLSRYLNDGNPATHHDLGVGILWLMPIFPARSYHGYDVTNFRGINPDYGTMPDFDRMLAEAHRRGVRIILDIPFNHTSSEHPWFKTALANPAAPQRHYYHFVPQGNGGACPATYHATTTPTEEKLCYQGAFDGSMPDLNVENPLVKQEIFQVAKFWLDKGVDGFRLDAAKHLFGEKMDPTESDILNNNNFWRDFSFFVYRIKPDAVLVGEVLGDQEILRRHTYGLDGLVDQPFMVSVRRNVDVPSPGFLHNYKQFITAARQVNKPAYISGLPFRDVPFHSFPYVASHDENPRLASFLADRFSHGMGRSMDAAYRLAAYYLLTCGRYPIIYNGDEVAQTGWKWNGNSPSDPRSPGDGSRVYDETLREPFPWYTSGTGTGQTRWFKPRFDRANDGVSVQEQQGLNSTLSLWRALANFRERHPVFANGDIGQIANDDGAWRVFEKVQGGQAYLVLINQTNQNFNYNFSASHLPRYRRARLLFWSDGARRRWKDNSETPQQINNSVLVPACGLVVLKP